MQITFKEAINFPSCSSPERLGFNSSSFLSCEKEVIREEKRKESKSRDLRD